MPGIQILPLSLARANELACTISSISSHISVRSSYFAEIMIVCASTKLCAYNSFSKTKSNADFEAEMMASKWWFHFYKCVANEIRKIWGRKIPLFIFGFVCNFSYSNINLMLKIPQNLISPKLLNWPTHFQAKYLHHQSISVGFAGFLSFPPHIPFDAKFVWSDAVRCGEHYVWNSSYSVHRQRAKV